MPPPFSIKEALAKSARWLAEKGMDTARLDAEVLLAHVLKLRRIDLYMQWDRPLADAEKDAYRALLKRRAEFEPVAYLTGVREFYSLDFAVSPAVLIPRPETELLVEKALQLLGRDAKAKPRRLSEIAAEAAETNAAEAAETNAAEGAETNAVEATGSIAVETKPTAPADVSREDSGEAYESPAESAPVSESSDAIAAIVDIADIGAGSGALCVALAKNLPGARVLATDTSAEALAVARKNAEAHGAAIGFRQTSLLDGVAEKFDLVVSNPPYIAESERGEMPPDVLRHEPAAALFAGPDGLDVIRPLIPAAAEHLKPGGWLVLEIGALQQAAVEGLIAQDGRYEAAITDLDYSGRPRVVTARRKA